MKKLAIRNSDVPIWHLISLIRYLNVFCLHQTKFVGCLVYKVLYLFDLGMWSQVFHEMVNSGIEPNVHTYGALIDGCAKAGQVAKAFGAYGILRSKV